MGWSGNDPLRHDAWGQPTLKKFASRHPAWEKSGSGTVWFLAIAGEPMMSDTEKSAVEGMVVDWARAVSAGDRQAILARHSDDFLMFDFPDIVEGIDAYENTWDFFYANPKGPIIFEPSDVRVTAGQDVAFVTCRVHCDGTSAGPLDFRLTVGLEKRNGEWVITHEHHSVPTIEERFINPSAQLH
jgi:ketosteroid isomerase-like protein